MLAILVVQNGVECYVVLNMRFKVDPDVLVHTLIEEYVHSQQVLDKVDFEREREQFAYAQRPYEAEAKRIATEVLGYNPAACETYLMREEPPPPLYDIK